MSLSSFYIAKSSLKVRELGVSLLETLAALVILSAGAAVMLTWFSQNATALGRLKDAEAAQLARLTALDYMRTINPVDRPQGEIILDKYRIEWSSRKIADTVRALNGLGSAGRYEISLYDLELKISNSDLNGNPLVEKITVSAAGYKLLGPSAVGSILGAASP
jgi:general secretion pathway protein I